MNHVLACIDGLSNTDAVIDWAAWAARRLQRPLEFLHVLAHADTHASAAPDHAELSGTIGINAQRRLLHELSAADAERSRRAREAGHALLASARLRAAAAGAGPLDGRMRRGELVDTVVELSRDARLVVLGEHAAQRDAGQDSPPGGAPGAPSGAGRLHLDHQVEQVIRRVRRPVLVATSDRFEPPQRVVIGFDGRPGAHRAIESLLQQPLLAGLPVQLAMAGDDSATARRALAEAVVALGQAGITVDSMLQAGAAHEVLPQLARADGPALLVMGAFGHSRLRQLLLGSTTTTVLRRSGVPVLLVR